ncbi:MAG TPA: hypothetical protein VFQ44_14025 [Streptosporangiaceae bacterium]|nr:hypothetical protein [Streptosporangiaceae bacterium]
MRGITGVAAIVIVVVGMAVLADGVTAASSSQPLPVVYGAGGHSGWQHGTIRPGVIYFGAGGSLLIRGLRWQSWTQNAAIGRGVRWADSCVPTCAAGNYARSPVEVTLSRVRKHAGGAYFTRLLLQWSTSGKDHKTVIRWFRGDGTVPSWS